MGWRKKTWRRKEKDEGWTKEHVERGREKSGEGKREKGLTKRA